MPTYEYECAACGHTLEEFQSFSEKPLRKCPRCGKMKLRRMIGAGAGIIFKGSGFYETDYKKKEAPKGGSADKKDSKSESSSESKCDSCKADCPGREG
jgi:putative FmdB family regulatory protein